LVIGAHADRRNSVFGRSHRTMAGQTVGHVAGVDNPFDQHAR